jgi:hypothetical protein
VSGPTSVYYPFSIQGVLRRRDGPQSGKPRRTRRRLHNLGPGDRSRTGEPYLGATVEFSNLWGGNVHMNTDANGEYSLRAPADVYNAVARDLENMTVDVVGRSNNVVEVPPSTASISKPTKPTNRFPKAR